jgi:hypothetical protein
MSNTWPKDSIALFEVAGRETTAELFKIAAKTAGGATTTAIITKAPAWLREIIPGIDAAAADRLAVLLSWSMYVQHTATVRELVRKWRIARNLGHAEGDALDLAMAQGAELAEQRFTSWALDLPLGETAPVTDRFMSALAERIVMRMRARQSFESESNGQQKEHPP